jgi:peptidoglycan/xylan/chitin deacetylase (PgdA/CDA1 family)
VTFAELPAGELADGEGPLVILSFDDGYRDFIEYAMPILDRFDLRVNQNVIPSCVVTGRPPWTVELADALTSAPPELGRRIVRLAWTMLGTPPTRHYRHTLIARLKSLPRTDRERFWQELQPLILSIDGARTRMMDLANVREAAAHHELGVHSFSHESMEFESNEYFLDDLRRCRTFFERELQSPMRIYAFPNGSYRDEQVRLLNQEGLEHVLLVGERASIPGNSVHHRFTFGGSSRSEVRLRAMGWTRPS